MACKPFKSALGGLLESNNWTLRGIHHSAGFRDAGRLNNVTTTGYSRIQTTDDVQIHHPRLKSNCLGHHNGFNCCCC